jgi:predicted nucleic acid-binding protein
MIKRIMLDTSPLGRIAHPEPNPETVSWLQGVLDAGELVFLPEIADYELRRNFLLEGMTTSIKRLDQLRDTLLYVPLSTAVMRKAAEFWAMARQRGRAAASFEALDGDVILAAQAHAVGAVVATENVGHLSWFVEARHWREIR